MQVLSKKLAKICDIKKMEAIPWQIKFVSNLLSNT